MNRIDIEGPYRRRVAAPARAVYLIAGFVIAIVGAASCFAR